MFRLTDKVAVVTGGARGIGKGICNVLAKQGAGIVIADLRVDEAVATAAEIEDAGGKAIAVRTDITDLASVQAMVAAAKETFGPVDILVNNAGWDRMKPFMKTGPDFWNKVIDINFKGVLNTTYAVANDMIERNSGKIINIASDAARGGQYGRIRLCRCQRRGDIVFQNHGPGICQKQDQCQRDLSGGQRPPPLLDDMKAEDAFADKVLSGNGQDYPVKTDGNRRRHRRGSAVFRVPGS